MKCCSLSKVLAVNCFNVAPFLRRATTKLVWHWLDRASYASSLTNLIFFPPLLYSFHFICLSLHWFPPFSKSFRIPTPIPLSLGLHCPNCFIWKSHECTIPAHMDTLCHLEPDSWPVGLHPVSQVRFEEVIPTHWPVSAVHHDFVRIIQWEHAPVHAAFTWRQPKLTWQGKCGEIKRGAAIYSKTLCINNRLTSGLKYMLLFPAY